MNRKKNNEKRSKKVSSWYWDRINDRIIRPIIIVLAVIVIVVGLYIRFSKDIYDMVNYSVATSSEIIEETTLSEKEVYNNNLKRAQANLQKDMDKSYVAIAVESSISTNEQRARDLYPYGTIIRNNHTGEIARVVKYQDTNLVTEDGWYVDISDIDNENYIIDGTKNYKEYRLKVDRENFKLNEAKFLEEQEKLKPSQTMMLKKLFPLQPKYAYIKSLKDNKYYRVVGYDGLFLVLENKTEIFYQDAKKITYNEFMEGVGLAKFNK